MSCNFNTCTNRHDDVDFYIASGKMSHT
jgi:hypothetical protein